MTNEDTVTLFRPVGQKELELIRESGWREFPPRLFWQPIFYPVLNEEYAVQIARDWNTKDAASGYAGYVTRFRVRKRFLGRYQVQTVGASIHQEYWIPAEELPEFNRNIVGEIEVIAEFRRPPDQQVSCDIMAGREVRMADVLVAPRVHRWTRDEYYRMGDADILRATRTELIEGVVIERRPAEPPHATAVGLAADALREVFGRGFVVRIQQPISLSGISEPEPDALVTAGRARDFSDAHPTTALLIVEVALSSLEYDRTDKASAYAKAGVPEYWVVNLVDWQAEVYRDPKPDDSKPHGFGYAGVAILHDGDSLSPLAAPEASIAIADLLP